MSEPWITESCVWQDTNNAGHVVKLLEVDYDATPQCYHVTVDEQLVGPYFNDRSSAQALARQWLQVQPA